MYYYANHINPIKIDLREFCPAHFKNVDTVEFIYIRLHSELYIMHMHQTKLLLQEFIKFVIETFSGAIVLCDIFFY